MLIAPAPSVGAVSFLLPPDMEIAATLAAVSNVPIDNHSALIARPAIMLVQTTPMLNCKSDMVIKNHLTVIFRSAERDGRCQYSRYGKTKSENRFHDQLLRKMHMNCSTH